jgi:two-component system OmpR family sensor kinase/two-component system sensor histidine kinase BaeS
MNLRPRVFTMMLTAFALVIVLGVGGMALLFGLAVAGAREAANPNMDGDFGYWSAPRDLGRYYARHGSWEGVEPEFMLFKDWHTDGDVLLLDADGQIVASSDDAWQVRAIPYRRCRSRPMGSRLVR